MRWLTVLVVTFVMSVPLGPAGRAAEPLPELKPGEWAFWDGEYVSSVDGTWSKDYEVRTTDGGHRLRVAIDLLMDYRADGSPHVQADSDRNFKLSVRDHTGELRSEATADGPAGYSAEVFLCFNGDPCEDPLFPCPAGDAACGSGQLKTGSAHCDADGNCYQLYGKRIAGDSKGTWTLRVTADDVDGWTFRMRAMLEKPPTSSDLSRLDEAVLPNLQSRPPSELTLQCSPVVGVGGAGRFGTCDPAAQGPVPGCSPQEVADVPSVRRCLRFSGGNGNAGEGPLEVQGSELRPAADANVLYATANQVLRTRNEQVARLEPAGELVYHKSHNHWHYVGFMHYELLEVEASATSPRRVSLVRRDPGPKAGWCPVDEYLADWERFFQEPVGTEGGGDLTNCAQSPPRPAQTTGWGDMYEWPREEQFVPFPTDDLGSPRAGLYVLRETVDPFDRLLETDDSDNAAYAYFEVASSGNVRVIERGIGSDPWDPHKRVA